MHTKRLFAIHGHHYGRGEKGWLLVFLVYFRFVPEQYLPRSQGMIWMIKSEKVCLRSLLHWLSCSQARAVNVYDTVGIYAGT